MGKSFNAALLLILSILLSFASIGEGVCNSVTHPDLEGVGEAGSQSSLSQGEQIKFQFLNRSGEHVVGPVNNLPAPPTKKENVDFSGVAHSIEQRVQHIATQYLLHAKEICVSLAGNDIIFPFHYFW